MFPYFLCSPCEVKQPAYLTSNEDQHSCPAWSSCFEAVTSCSLQSNGAEIQDPSVNQSVGIGPSLISTHRARLRCGSTCGRIAPWLPHHVFHRLYLPLYNILYCGRKSYYTLLYYTRDLALRSNHEAYGLGSESMDGSCAGTSNGTLSRSALGRSATDTAALTHEEYSTL